MDVIDHKIKINKLEEYLDNLAEKMLYRTERDELIQTVDLKDSRGRQQKAMVKLNQYFDENNLSYTIRSYTNWYRTDGHLFKHFRKVNPYYGKVYWIIFRTNKTAIHDLFHNPLAKTIIM